VKKLYYLPEDIDENYNIYVERPEVVDRLQAAASAFDADLVKNSRPVGRVR
jgi:hypothetical protein